jgi:hypothetical protein
MRSLYRAGSLKTVASKLMKYNLDIVTVQEVRWDEGGSQPTNTFYGNGNANHYLETQFFVHKGITSAGKMVEFISDRISYTTVRVRWCDIIVLNVHAPTKDKSDDMITFMRNYSMYPTIFRSTV